MSPGLGLGPWEEVGLLEVGGRPPSPSHPGSLWRTLPQWLTSVLTVQPAPPPSVPAHTGAASGPSCPLFSPIQAQVLYRPPASSSPLEGTVSCLWQPS